MTTNDPPAPTTPSSPITWGGLAPADVEAVRRAAAEDHPGVITLIQDLVRIPSRGGLDDYRPVLDRISTWLGDHDLPTRQLHDPTRQLLGITCDVAGAWPGPHYVLDACADTAPFGDEISWRHPPTSAVIEDGWLYGRGAADSKAAIAIFAHLAARLRHQTERMHGTLTVLFDAD